MFIHVQINTISHYIDFPYIVLLDKRSAYVGPWVTACICVSLYVWKCILRAGLSSFLCMDKSALYTTMNYITIFNQEIMYEGLLPRVNQNRKITKSSLKILIYKLRNLTYWQTHTVYKPKTINTWSFYLRPIPNR